MRILTKINEVDITNVRIGQDVKITLDAIRGRVYHGQVTEIASLGKTEEDITTYEVVIEVLDADERLKPEMTADVDIIIERRDDVLYVPLEVVREGRDRKMVLIRRDNRFIPKRIKTRLQDETNVEIVEGLNEGEEVKLKGLALKKEKDRSPGGFGSSGHSLGMGRGLSGR